MTLAPPLPTGHDPDTLAFYNANGATYVLARPAGLARELQAFLPRLAPGSHVLELGCGSGADAEAMENAGFVVDATDGAAAMVALASQRLRRPARLLRFDDLASVAAYDAVIANASLLHVPRAGLAAVLRRVWTALKPGGWHFASFKTAGQPGPDAHQRYYNQLSRDDARQFYAGAGQWSQLLFDEFDGVGYFSAPCRWLTVTAQK